MVTTIRQLGRNRMAHILLPFGCLLILIYVAIVYYFDSRDFRSTKKLQSFDYILLLGFLNVLLDIGKSYGVNHLDTIEPAFTRILYGLFFISTDVIVFYLCYVILSLTGTLPKKRLYKIIVYTPFTLNVLAVLFSIRQLQFVEGTFTNYSRGFPATTCFIMAAVYIAISGTVLLMRWNYIERYKRTGIITYIIALIVVGTVRLINPELFITSIGATIFVLGVYMTIESPSIRKVEQFHSDTVTGFASLIDNRDHSTGGHIRRTGIYVELITKELLAHNVDNPVLTRDFVKNVVNAAPMHDIGKISIPDSILQKPGPLTLEEYAVIQQHTVIGGSIINETFDSLGSTEYRRIAHNVARYHHEKWDGTGYPDGLKGTEIPLGARIMAVADVFDALSADRCYRGALSLDDCFEAIQKGRGTDFDPQVVDAFLNIRPEVERVYSELNLATAE